MLKFRITGDTEIAKALRDLPSRVSKQVAFDAVEAAVQPIVDAARALVPVGDTGGLKRSIGFKVARLRRRRTVTYGIVGARRGYGVPDPSKKTGMTEPANYAHLVEDGHSVAGKVFQHVEANPFLRPAFDATAEKALANLAETLGAGIEAEAALLAQKTAKRAARAAKRAARARAQAVALGAPVT